jgi:two-component system, chemotaxis family, CheB/CheR fusion protein
MQVGYRLHFALSCEPSPQFLSGSVYSSTAGNGLDSSPALGRRKTTSEIRTALVVDDVADVTEMLQVLLSHAGYDVVTAPSAKAALKAANERQFDVIISDIGMPEMNGYQLAEALRQLPAYKTVPLVAVTGYSMFDDRERSLKAGFNAHMTKPIDPRALLDLIEQL